MAWLAAAAVLLVAAPPSFAPTRGELLGGGSVGPATTAGHVDVDFTTIRISKDGKSLHFYGDWPARCSDGPAPASGMYAAMSTTSATTRGRGPAPRAASTGTARAHRSITFCPETART